MKHGRTQRGAALLMAMLTVTLVATFAAAAMWQQWRGVEVEQAERARVQSAWILTGALDWARLILREDVRAGGGTESPDHLSEPWAVPLEEARLSTFLAAEKGVATNTSGDDELDAFLSGQIVDQQALLNVKNLVDDKGKVSDPWLRSFRRLFELLGLPPAQVDTLAENLRFAADTTPTNRSAPLASLMPQRVEQLVWLGLTADTVAALRPYVTLLPARATVNLNTAAAEVIFAAVEGLTLADAQRLVAERDRSHFRTIDDAKKLVGRDVPGFTDEHVNIKSRFFESRGRLRLGQIVVEERSLLERTGAEVRAIQRERGVIEAPRPGATLPGR